MQTFLQDGDEQINGDGTPDLGAHGVLARTVEGFDAQMLFDPFEEQFDLPAATIQLGDCQGGRGEVVGQKDQSLTSLGVAIARCAAARQDNHAGRKSRSSPRSGQNAGRWFCPRGGSNGGRSGSFSWRG